LEGLRQTGMAETPFRTIGREWGLANTPKESVSGGTEKAGFLEAK